MTLAGLSDQQLAAEKLRYQALSQDPATGEDARKVAWQRLAEVNTELMRRKSPNGHAKGAYKNRWPNVDLADLIRESGIILKPKGDDRLVGDHGSAHGSQSGECLVIWPKEGRWHCSSCKKGGDAAEWLALREGISYKEAARQLRDQFGGDDRKSLATTLVELTRKQATLFHTATEECYCRFESAGHRETWPLRSSGFRRWLARAYFDQTGLTVYSQAVADAIGNLEGLAQFTGPELPVYTRLAGDDGAIYLDLGDSDWRAVEVTPAGWRILAEPPVRFRRGRGARALPDPERGGSVEELRAHLNVIDDSAWRLIVGWLVGCYCPTGPYPILMLTGEQGAAKSTAARMLRSLVDPAWPMLRSEPREVRDLLIAGTQSWCVAYDNLSKLPDWLSDCLCRLSTGGGFGTRQLYSDDEERLFEATRPVVVASIEELAHRGDLADRSVIVSLPAIPEDKRRPESEILREFDVARPRILGALLDSVSEALAYRPRVHASRLPRMADHALWVTAAEGRLGWERGTFIADVFRNKGDHNSLALDASPVYPALESLLSINGDWTGTASDLLGALETNATDSAKRSKDWPKDATRLSGHLSRLAPNLRAVGIRIEKEYAQRSRRITLAKAKTPDQTTPPATVTTDGAPAPCNADNASDADNGLPPPIYDEEHAPTQLWHDDPEQSAESPAAGAAADTSERAADSTLDKWGYSVATVASVVSVASFAELEAALPDLLAAPIVGLDCETTGLDPHADQLRLIQLATPTAVYVVDLFAFPGEVSLEPVLSGRTLVGHNLKFDLQFLMAAGLTPGPCFDTMLADQLLKSSRKPRKLSEVAEEYVHVKLDKTAQTSDWSGELTPAQIEYAARDAGVLLPLHEALTAALSTARMQRVADIENRCTPAVAWLEYAGAPFDTDAWHTLADATLAEKIGAEEELTETVGSELAATDLFGGRKINWESSEQVGKVLRQLGLPATNTKEETLVALADRHPIVGRLLTYRELAKRCGTYGPNVLGLVNGTTGRIHADWYQLGSEAGRMSCHKPNLQQVPRSLAYRACFRAPAGRMLVKADYSQIELRIAAEMAGDQRMLEAFCNGDDLHRLTAQLVLGKSEVSKADRQAAKALNFGLVYGMGAKTLREHAKTNYGVSLSQQEAERFRTAYFDAYRGIRRWHGSQPEGRMSTRTVAGRRRLGVESYTAKLNSPIQGTGADGLKAALGLLWETRGVCPSAVPVLVVHDEVVMECDEADAWTCREWLVGSMKAGMQPFLKQVPVEVEATVARDWSLAEPIEPALPGVKPPIDEESGRC